MDKVVFSKKKKPTTNKKVILTVYPDLALLLTWSHCLRRIVSRDSEEKWLNRLSKIFSKLQYSMQSEICIISLSMQSASHFQWCGKRKCCTNLLLWCEINENNSFWTEVIDESEEWSSQWIFSLREIWTQ